MQRHEFIKRILAAILCITAGSALILWRLGLAPVYACLIGVNAVTLILYGYDKRQAIIGGTRIPESVLHVMAILGGSPGALLGQATFRHKTRNRSFRLAFAGILVVQGLLICGYWRFLRG